MAGKAPSWAKITEENRQRVADIVANALARAEKDGSDKPFVAALRAGLARLPIERRSKIRDVASYRQTDLSRRLGLDATREAARSEIVEAVRAAGSILQAAVKLEVGHRTLCRIIAGDDELGRRLARLRREMEKVA